MSDAPGKQYYVDSPKGSNPIETLQHRVGTLPTPFKIWMRIFEQLLTFCNPDTA